MVFWTLLGTWCETLISLDAWVSHQNTFQIPFVVVYSERVLISDKDLVGKMCHKDSSITMACDIQIIFLKFLESCEESRQRFNSFLNKDLIVDWLSFITNGTEPHTCGQLQIEQIGLIIPGVIIELEVMGCGIENKGPILMESSKKTGTSRSSRQPDNKWVFWDIILRLKEDIVNAFVFDKVNI